MLSRYNSLLPVINSSLKTLLKAIKGTVVMSDPLEKLGDSMFSNQLPQMWRAAPCYETLKPLASWVTDLEDRLAFLKKCTYPSPPPPPASATLALPGTVSERLLVCVSRGGRRYPSGVLDLGVLLPAGVHHRHAAELRA